MSQKEGSGEIQISASGAHLMKVKQEAGEKMKKDAKKKKAKDSIGARVKRMKKKDGKSTSSGPYSPSLLKSQDVVNLVVQAHGKSNLARACTDDETPETVPEGWFCIHEKYISKCHLRFPLPTLLLDLLDHYQLALSQLCPSVIRVVNGFITRAKEEGVIVGLSELMSLFLIKESSSKDGGSGTYYLPCRPRLGIFKFTASDDDWRKKYFYVKIDPSTVPGYVCVFVFAYRDLLTSLILLAEIEDPVKLSGKLTRALYRKLQHSPNTLGAYTTTRVGSARFPERYKASFPDSVSVAGLEVSEGESIFSVSSGASTSEKTQSQKMPIQPSFRSRGRSTKAASSSRGSDKNQGGSFLSSVKEVLDDGGSAPAKDAGRSEPKVQEVVPHSEVPKTEADPQMLAGAINRAQFKFEDTVHNAPITEELAQVTELVKATKTELDQARIQVSELQAEVKRLGSKADVQQGTIESQAIDIQVKNRKIGELDSARKIAEYQVKELIASSQDNQKNKEAEVKLAVRKGKKEVADAYNKILVSVKEKFSKKKDEVDLLVYAQELQANTELLKDMLDNEIKSAKDEYHRLVAMMPEAVAAYEKAQVSDFSLQSRRPRWAMIRRQKREVHPKKVNQLKEIRNIGRSSRDDDV
ncbi:uncharacterized protein At3g60930, chloroplastic-like [Raphanus sativus]|uniref:Uncharacterized protein At3g60930, chloroplastic-like n=1 Tax=Raphanus sativus TaxID=3726 RepID=A0A9W3D8G3_RAPSA|nr:uncharacterized protein At3g60930, chloroplastic-like [Raphanus sativus]